MVEGKRAGARRAAPSSTGGGRGRLAVLALGITLTLVAWGYLVWLAIDFGVSARSGEAAGWWMLALASLGAIACLFVALILASQVLRALSITREGGRGSSGGGGRRAAR